RLFAVKLFMEQALVRIVPTAEAKGTLQIAYTERRFSEAKRLLADQSSVLGLSYLKNQVDGTKDTILQAKNPAVKRELAQKYVVKLREVNSQLEEQKQIAVQTRPPTKSTPTPTPASPVTPPAPDVEQTIEEAQENIDDAIEELENQLDAPPENNE
ncbi:MAG: hypothetical protein UY49_C0041G0013, partial [Microgenomates group bacterium GW2011_GWC1_49_7]